MIIRSFSFRYNDVESLSGHIIDARVIMNPAIRVHKGMVVTDGDLRAEVLGDAVAKELIEKGVKYLEENPNGNLLIGCDYGRHRSVAVANAIADHFGVKAEHISPGSNGKMRAIVVD